MNNWYFHNIIFLFCYAIKNEMWIFVETCQIFSCLNSLIVDLFILDFRSQMSWIFRNFRIESLLVRKTKLFFVYFFSLLANFMLLVYVLFWSEGIMSSIRNLSIATLTYEDLSTMMETLTMLDPTCMNEKTTSKCVFSTDAKSVRPTFFSNEEQEGCFLNEWVARGMLVFGWGARRTEFPPETFGGNSAITNTCYKNFIFYFYIKCKNKT